MTGEPTKIMDDDKREIAHLLASSHVLARDIFTTVEVTGKDASAEDLISSLREAYLTACAIQVLLKRAAMTAEIDIMDPELWV